MYIKTEPTCSKSLPSIHLEDATTLVLCLSRSDTFAASGEISSRVWSHNRGWCFPSMLGEGSTRRGKQQHRTHRSILAPRMSRILHLASSHRNQTGRHRVSSHLISSYFISSEFEERVQHLKGFWLLRSVLLQGQLIHVVPRFASDDEGFGGPVVGNAVRYVVPQHLLCRLRLQILQVKNASAFKGRGVQDQHEAGGQNVSQECRSSSGEIVDHFQFVEASYFGPQAGDRLGREDGKRLWVQGQNVLGAIRGQKGAFIVGPGQAPTHLVEVVGSHKLQFIGVLQDLVVLVGGHKESTVQFR
mmetsp:Transcript_42183/g.90616  ORF Transcript_42183/g.90616 Transcript_42183/m.90616 type:complete len:301 (+) Transcript_42183:107-1009(+)